MEVGFSKMLKIMTLGVPILISLALAGFSPSSLFPKPIEAPPSPPHPLTLKAKLGSALRRFNPFKKRAVALKAATEARSAKKSGILSSDFGFSSFLGSGLMGSTTSNYYSPELEAKGWTRSQTDEINSLLVRRLIEVADAPGWVKVGERDGAAAWRKKTKKAFKWPHGGGPVEPEKIRFDAIKGTGLVNAAPKDLFEFFKDISRVSEYNEFCDEIIDLGWIDSRTKITWSATRYIGPLNPRDFVTRVHFAKFADGTYMVANLGEQFDCTEQRQNGRYTDRYVRMEVLTGGSIFRPVPGNPHLTNYTGVSYSNPGGMIDSAIGAFLVNNIAAKAPIEVVEKLRECVKRGI